MPTPEEYTAQIAEGLEGALTILAMTADVAAEAGRTNHRTSILAVVRQLEDMRARQDEFESPMLDPVFPMVVRTGKGVPRSQRIAVANDGSVAIYKLIESTNRVARTPYYFVYPFAPGSKVARSRPPEPMNLAYLADPHKYVWDAPEELEATTGRVLKGVGG